MNLAEPFIRRPVATVLLTLGLVLAGVLGFTLLPVSPLPQVDYPTIQVSAQLPGASPETMAATVATPLERALGKIAGVTEITSSSSLGNSRVTLQFDLSRSIDGAAREVQAAATRILRDVHTLAARYGWDGALTQMGWFFTKAALLTFGGAYAVLPYVYQGAVDHYQWLTGTQMIDGLALGETTPGPLIMVVAFVGFVGGWTKALFGPDALLLAGAAAATVATFFTFLPSFLFILIGGPVVESTHGELKFTAPLTGITAAVVGVILSLAVFFAYHVLWVKGLSGPFDWMSAVIGIAAGIALFKFKVGISQLIAVCAGLGLAISFARPILG